MKTLYFLILSFIIISCGSTKNTPSVILQASLENTNWQLSEAMEGKMPTISISEGKVTGNAGCNKYFGEALYDAKTGAFSAKNIGATKMACGNMKIEQQFLEILPKATTYKVNNNTLELYSGKLLLLKFDRIQ